jgi:hypothetical protein
MQEANDGLIGGRHTCLDGRAEKSAVENGPRPSVEDARGETALTTVRGGASSAAIVCFHRCVSLADMVWATFIA